MNIYYIVNKGDLVNRKLQQIVDNEHSWVINNC